jgi:hypothetical protein
MFRSYTYPNSTPRHTVEAIWNCLQQGNPELRKAYTLDQSGFTHSGQVITATFQGERVWQGVYFQVFQKRWIHYVNQQVWNLWTPEEVWRRYAQSDERILPLELYDVLDKRPWESHGVIEFRTKEGVVPDTTENGCGSAGGDGPYGPLPRIGSVPPGREHGKLLAIAAGNPGQLGDRES